MAERRVFKCDIPGCPCTKTEDSYGVGFPEWGQLKGIKLNAVENPLLCPKHLSAVANFVDALKEN